MDSVSDIVFPLGIEVLRYLPNFLAVLGVQNSPMSPSLSVCHAVITILGNTIEIFLYTFLVSEGTFECMNNSCYHFILH